MWESGILGFPYLWKEDEKVGPDHLCPELSGLSSASFNLASLPFPLVDVLEEMNKTSRRVKSDTLVFSERPNPIFSLPPPTCCSCPVVPSARMGLRMKHAKLLTCLLPRGLIQSPHPSNFLFLGSSSAFLSWNLMYNLISLFAQNCVPTGYLPAVPSGKEFGMVGLTLDSASG